MRYQRIRKALVIVFALLLAAGFPAANVHGQEIIIVTIDIFHAFAYNKM
jgi:hypothetical protein